MLATAHIDCCVLANNHILDWGRAGLLDTLTTLKRLGVKSAGAGRTLEEARAAAVLPISGNGRVLVFSFAAITSGTPRNWAATSGAAGVTFSLICPLRPSIAPPIGALRPLHGELPEFHQALTGKGSAGLHRMPARP